MRRMRKFTREEKLQADSREEIARCFKGAVLRLESKVKFDRRKLRPGPFLNAMVIHFLEMTEADQEQFGQQVVAQMEQFLAETALEREAATVRLHDALTQPPPVGNTSYPVAEAKKRSRRSQ